MGIFDRFVKWLMKEEEPAVSPEPVKDFDALLEQLEDRDEPELPIPTFHEFDLGGEFYVEEAEELPPVDLTKMSAPQVPTHTEMDAAVIEVIAAATPVKKPRKKAVTKAPVKATAPKKAAKKASKKKPSR